MMTKKRQSGMGPNPIADSEIVAFFKKHRITPEPWQLQAIDLLDQLSLAPPTQEKEK